MAQFLNRLKNLSLKYDEKFSDVTNWLSELENSVTNSELFNSSNSGFFLLF